MKIWHVTKTEEAMNTIRKSKLLLPGTNVSRKESGDTFVHVNLVPFEPGQYALDVIGKDTNEAWILELTIPDNIALVPDPSGEGEWYGGRWMVAREPIPIVKILKITEILNVSVWEAQRGRGAEVIFKTRG